jgi:hypothetical protein
MPGRELNWKIFGSGSDLIEERLKKTTKILRQNIGIVTATPTRSATKTIPLSYDVLNIVSVLLSAGI